MLSEISPRQRGPYIGRDARLSYEGRLALRAAPRPHCKCGCGTLTRWLSSQTRWAVYARGHYRSVAPYKDEKWLREQYLDSRRTTQDIADEFSVSRTTVRKQLMKLGIERRSRSESRIGRKVGERNPSWKGGVADWDYAAGWKVIARKIRDRDRWTCQRCHEQRQRWGNSLHVHHIDENKLNNDPTNLISLCSKCHRSAHRGGVI
jgi:hypothetical protein